MHLCIYVIHTVYILYILYRCVCVGASVYICNTHCDTVILIYEYKNIYTELNEVLSYDDGICNCIV